MPLQSPKRKGPRFRLALLAAKLSTVALKVTRHKGTNFPGVLAEKVCPDFISRFDAPERSIFVTGSTGKTTTTNLVNDILDFCGMDQITNRAGSNITSGIGTSLIQNSTLGGHLKKGMVAMEIDERYTPLILPHMNPDVVVCTNIGRDSFHRNSNVDVVYEVLDRGLDCGATLVLNGDDLISHDLALKTNPRRVYFGIDRLPGEPDEPDGIINDRAYCPRCGTKLAYEFSHYNHIGRAHCPNCDFGSPALDYEMTDIDFSGKTCRIRENKEPGAPTYTYRAVGEDITDLYNELAAIAGVRELGIPAEDVQRAMEGINITASRLLEEQVGSYRLVHALTKGWNPIACSRSFNRVRNIPGDKAVIVILEDSRDIDAGSELTCYFYETDFEYLHDPSIKQLVICGFSGGVLSMRLLLGGFSKDEFDEAPFDGAAAADMVDLEGIDTIVLSYDVYNRAQCAKCVNRLRERIGERQ